MKPSNKGLTLKDLQDAIQGLMQRPSQERKITLQTGPGGADLFEETFEELADPAGFKRVYLQEGNQEFMKAVLEANGIQIRTSLTGRLYYFKTPKP